MKIRRTRRGHVAFVVACSLGAFLCVADFWVDGIDLINVLGAITCVAGTVANLRALRGLASEEVSP